MRGIARVKFLAPFLVLKLAFIYCEDHAVVFLPGHAAFEPTFRVSVQLLPHLKTPKVTVALSTVSDDGTITPYGITTLVKPREVQVP